MKNLFLLLGLICFSASFAQEKENIEFKRNEFKGNALFLILGQPELTYERILNPESGLGISTNFALESDFETRFSLTPYYRFYFGKKPASGFFVEGFSMLNTIKVDDYQYYKYDYNSNNYYYETVKGDKYTDFALGFGVGFKLISKRGMILEINGGIGRNLLNSEKNDFYDHTFVGRGGITAGYRF